MSESNVTLSSTVLGTIGTVLWCIQLIPQIWHNWRRKKTDGFPAAMMFLWASCEFLPVSCILERIKARKRKSRLDWAHKFVIVWHFKATEVQSGFVVRFDMVVADCGYSRNKAVLVCSAMVVLFGGLEALLILTLRIPYNNGVTWPDIVVGVVAAILLSAGLLPPYFELWKRDGRVIGINWVFLSIDTLGGLFSLFALAAQGSFDILGGIMYILVVVLEAGIYTSHIVWRIRYRRLRQEAKASGQSIDEFLAVDREDTQETQDLEKGVVPQVPSDVDMARSEQLSTYGFEQRDRIQKV
ncbi:hypothetical protein N7541_006501 [Penicillium brevicompactum]|uniref:PQ loop repeat protein n=1 Tax=Penicillium brevicompactum TaxID=5074 RepID=A0A9W9UQV5_PENBR|nr:hypothetical protein N7541_006501 [Penicillium brevicompactum]